MQGKLYPEHELRITPIMNIDMMMIALSDNNPRNMCVLIGIARASAKIIPYAAKADYLSAPIDLLILFAVDKLGLYGTKIIDFNTACGHNSENAAAVLHAEELGVAGGDGAQTHQRVGDRKAEQVAQLFQKENRLSGMLTILSASFRAGFLNS